MIPICPFLDKLVLCAMFKHKYKEKVHRNCASRRPLKVLELTAAKPYKPTAQEHRAVADHIARKSGHKHVHGGVYKPKSWGQAFFEFFAASRGGAVVAKAHFESKHYAQAAILRKHAVAEHEAENKHGSLSDQEYDDTVWNSNGVQNRLTREDHLRYGDKAQFQEMNGASKRSRVARGFSRAGHVFHGLCELNSAPTGLTQNCVRNGTVGKIDEKSMANKGFMLATLAFIGTGFTTGLRFARGGAVDSAKESSKTVAELFTTSVIGSLIAFPALSATMGFFGTLAGVCSQATVRKEALSPNQRELWQEAITNDLQKLLYVLKTIKDNPEKIEVIGKAMQGRHHILKKIKSNACEDNGVPKILTKALNAIDPNKSENDNLNALKTALGEHMLVEKPPKETSSFWQRYKYSKQVTNKETEYVALMSVVDHPSLKNPHADSQKDLRKTLEEKLVPSLRNAILKGLAYPATVVDKVIDTNIASTLRKWASTEYLERQARKMADPARAQKNFWKGEYMAKHSHQYGLMTRSLIRLSESLRLLATTVVLAQNANLSRAFANAAASIQRTLGTGPASRSMCQSIGRFFGGAALAILIGAGIPAAAESSGAGYTLEMDVGTGSKAYASAVNSGILMFLLSIPSFILMGAASIAARNGGWEGNLSRKVPEGVKTYTM